MCTAWGQRMAILPRVATRSLALLAMGVSMEVHAKAWGMIS